MVGFAAAVAGGILIGSNLGDGSTGFSSVTVTMERALAVPGPQQTMTVIEQVNPPIVPPKVTGRAAVPPLVGVITTKGPWAGYTVWFAKWTSVPVAVAYKVWVDGKLTGTQAATPGATQGITLPVRCGVRHLLNFQVQDAAGAVGPKRPTAATFTPKPC